MDLVGKAKRVRIYIGEAEMIGHRPADAVIVEWLRRENAQGATVLRGVSGFGATGEIHVSNLVDVAQNLPVIVEWVDAGEVVARLLPQLKQMVPRGLITMDDTEIVLHQPHPIRDLSRAVTVADVMSREVTAVAKDAPLRQVVDLMLGKTYRAVPVVEKRVPVGIITNGDLVRKGGLGVRVDLLESLDKPEIHAVLERLAAGNKVAGDVMTSGPVTIDASTPLPRAAEVMRHRRLKRLPVVDEHGALAGMLSRVDLLRTVAGGLERKATTAREMGLAGDTPLARVMRRDIPTVHPDTALPGVFQAVVSTRLNRALVVDSDHRVVGLVTDAELLERLTPSLRRAPFARSCTGSRSVTRRARRRPRNGMRGLVARPI